MIGALLLALQAGCSPQKNPPTEEPKFYPHECLEADIRSNYPVPETPTGIPTVIHLFAQDEYAQDYEATYRRQIDEQFEILNRALAPFQYFIDLKPLVIESGNCDIDVLYEDSMSTVPQVKGAIDVYYCHDEFADSDKNEIAAFAAGEQGLVTMRDWIEQDNILAHEFGHTLGLLHTFENAFGEGSELVDGSNSSRAGDFLSDTPADTNPIDESTECQIYAVDCPEGYEYGGECYDFDCPDDANGQEYHPDPTNLLSYYDWADSFSLQQAQVMTCVLDLYSF